MIRQMARRVGGSDIAEFGAMWEVFTEAEHAVSEAIDGLRASGYSWARIAAEIGWTKQRLFAWRTAGRRSGVKDSFTQEESA